MQAVVARERVQAAVVRGRVQAAVARERVQAAGGPPAKDVRTVTAVLAGP